MTYLTKCYYLKPIKSLSNFIPKTQIIQLNGQKTQIDISKEDIEVANRYMKRCATPFIIREIQIKTILRYHHTPVRMAKINNARENRYGKDVK